MRLSTAAKIRIARALAGTLLAARRLAGAGPVARARRHGVAWELDLREGIDLSIYLLGSFEPATLAAYTRLVKPGMTVVDIGANVGAHTLHLARLCGPAGRVVAIEPTAYAFGKLRRNLALNPQLAAHVTSVQCLLTATDTQPVQAAVYSSWPVDGADDNLHAEHRGRLMATDGAIARTLDTVLAGQGLERLDFIKLDVDGHEPDVLRGAAATFERWRPLVLLELAPFVFGEDMAAFGSILAFFRDRGYELLDVATGRRLPRETAAVVRAIPANGGINVLARPA